MSRRLHRARAVWVAGLHTVTVLPVLWFATHLVWGDATWWLFLVNTFAIYLFPIAFLAAGTALLLGVRSAFFILLPTVGLTLALYGGLFLPPGSPGRSDALAGPRLTVLTYNVNIDNPDPEGVVRAIAAVNADVVAVQELSTTMASALTERLATDYPFHVMDASEHWDGMGVLSRYPIERTSFRIDGASTGNPEVLRIFLPERAILFANVHNLSTPRYLPSWPTEIGHAMRERRKVADGIARMARAQDMPLLVVGDFNTTERSASYRTITGALRDTWREAGRGFGFSFPGGPRRPSPLGVAVPPWILRIDYIFHSNDWRPVTVAMGPWDGWSDHRGLHATFALEVPGY